jgi:hypothetical protein
LVVEGVLERREIVRVAREPESLDRRRRLRLVASEEAGDEGALAELDVRQAWRPLTCDVD